MWTSSDDSFQFFVILTFFELINVNFIHLFYCILPSVSNITNEETDGATFLHDIACKYLNYFSRVQ